MAESGRSLLDVLEATKRLEQAAGAVPVVKVHFLRNVTVDTVVPYLKCACLSQGIAVDVQMGAFGQFEQEALGFAGDLFRAPPDVVSVVLDLEEMSACLGRDFYRSTEHQIEAEMDRIVETIRSMVRSLAAKGQALVLVNGFVPAPYDEFGILETKVLSRRACVHRLNARLREWLRQESGAMFVDAAHLAACIGLEAAIDRRFKNMARAPFSTRFMEAWANELARHVLALRGKARKCLVVDCDNTLWGGVVGEDGIDGIKLDPDNAPGNAFYALQVAIDALQRRGIVVALCSRNNEQDVRDVFERHTGMRLGWQQISAHRINWQDKAGNIESIARELNLGLQSIAFLDDSPEECAQVRSVLPEVQTILLPKDIHAYAATILREGTFDSLSLTREDVQRGEMYQAEQRRQDARMHHATHDDFLKTLQIVLTARRMSPEDVQRVAQLTQKTNQLNVTTRRYSADQIRAFGASDQYRIYTLQVADRFGESGLTGVVIFDVEGGSIRIDTYLLSCRVLGRGIEEAFLIWAVKRAIREGRGEHVLGQFIPTQKNQPASTVFPQVGFELDGVGEDGSRSYRLSRAAAEALALKEYYTIREELE